MTTEMKTRPSVLSWTLTCIQRVTAFVSALLLVMMMGVTVIDTIGRYFFNRPLAGAAEWVELTMGLIVFAGMFQAAHHGEHVRLDLLDQFWPSWAEQFIKAVSGIISMVIMLLLASQLGGKVAELREFNDVSAYLGLPLAPLGVFMIVMIILCAAVYLTQVCGLFKKNISPDLVGHKPS